MEDPLTRRELLRSGHVQLLADNGRTGTNTTCIQTFGGSGPAAPPGCTNLTTGGTLYQNSWVTITVPLGANYGASGLTPPGETEEGWWKVRYTVNSGNDTTTWEVSLRGQPGPPRPRVVDGDDAVTSDRHGAGVAREMRY